MYKYESSGAVRRQAALGGYVSISTAVNLTVFKDCACVTKDKIHVSLDEAVAEVLPPGSSIQRILPAHKPAFPKGSAVGMRRNRYGLSFRPVAVLERNIGRFKLRALHIDSAAKECAADILGSRIERDHCCGCIDAAK